MKNLKIGLCGTGNVGYAFAKTIINSKIDNTSNITMKTGLEILV